MRTPKINQALKDVYEISSGSLKQCIGRALDELQYGRETECIMMH